MFKSRKGGMKLNINGFTFDKNVVTNGNYYWNCEKKKKYGCKTRVVTVFSKKEDKHLLKNNTTLEHNHEPDIMRLEISDAINKIKDEAALNLDKPINKVITDCIAELATTSAAVIPYLPKIENLRQILRRYRLKSK